MFSSHITFIPHFISLSSLQKTFKYQEQESDCLSSMLHTLLLSNTFQLQESCCLWKRWDDRRSGLRWNHVLGIEKLCVWPVMKMMPIFPTYWASDGSWTSKEMVYHIISGLCPCCSRLWIVLFSLLTLDYVNPVFLYFLCDPGKRAFLFYFVLVIFNEGEKEFGSGFSPLVTFWWKIRYPDSWSSLLFGQIAALSVTLFSTSHF